MSAAPPWQRDGEQAPRRGSRRERPGEAQGHLRSSSRRRWPQSVPTIMLFSADLVTVRNEKVRNYVQHPTGWYYGLARTYLAQ